MAEWYHHQSMTKYKKSMARCQIILMIVRGQSTAADTLTTITKNKRAIPLILVHLATIIGAGAGAASATASIHNTLNRKDCAVCIERWWPIGGKLRMNFKSQSGENNWNHERFGRHRQHDCTNERVDGGWFSKLELMPEDDGCLCFLHLTCHQDKTAIINAWVTLRGPTLERIYLKKWPGGNPHKDGCPSDCIKYDDRGRGFNHMNIHVDALRCGENDEDCKLNNIDIAG